MIREYIFCSVIESPQMASRSPGWSSSPSGAGALSGLYVAKYGSAGSGLPRLRPERRQERRHHDGQDFHLLFHGA